MGSQTCQDDLSCLQATLYYALRRHAHLVLVWPLQQGIGVLDLFFDNDRQYSINVTSVYWFHPLRLRKNLFCRLQLVSIFLGTSSLRKISDSTECFNFAIIMNKNMFTRVLFSRASANVRIPGLLIMLPLKSISSIVSLFEEVLQDPYTCVCYFVIF